VCLLRSTPDPSPVLYRRTQPSISARGGWGLKHWDLQCRAIYDYRARINRGVYDLGEDFAGGGSGSRGPESATRLSLPMNLARWPP